MLDIIGFIALTALFGACAGALIGLAPVERASRRQLTAVALLWFAAVGVLAALELYAASGVGTPAIGATTLVPLVLAVWVVRRSPSLRALALETPLPALVAVHAGRILGVFFLLLLAAGRLPPTFALIAGWGDIAIAAAALPLAWAIHRRAGSWRALTSAWNAVGLLDLVTAVTLGVGSARSPARFIFESPDSGALGHLPWVLIPTVLVPLYLLTHVAIFVRLRRERARARDAGAQRMQPAFPGTV